MAGGGGGVGVGVGVSGGWRREMKKGSGGFKSPVVFCSWGLIRV